MAASCGGIAGGAEAAYAVDGRRKVTPQSSRGRTVIRPTGASSGRQPKECRGQEEQGRVSSGSRWPSSGGLVGTGVGTPPYPCRQRTTSWQRPGVSVTPSVAAVI